MEVELSLGEVVDRMTILELKKHHLQDPEAVRSIGEDLVDLELRWRAQGHPPRAELAHHADLYAVNAALWDIEDALRACEATLEFGDRFVALARDVYRLNDRRSALKRAIDQDLGSAIMEWKSHTPAKE